MACSANSNPAAEAADANPIFFRVFLPIRASIAFLPGLQGTPASPGNVYLSSIAASTALCPSQAVGLPSALVLSFFMVGGGGGCSDRRSVSQLFRALSAGFRGGGAVLRHHRDPRHSGQDCRVPRPSAPGRHPCGGMGEPVHPTRAVAVSLDLGDGVPPRTGLGDLASICAGRRDADGRLQRPRRLAAASGGPREEPEERGPIMELLLILIYVSICYVVFKLFRIPVNQWSLATAALGGIVGIALLLLIMNYNHPFTKNARIYFAVTPVLPTVRGRVVEVPVKENAPLKEGDVLFRIDPKPYEYVVEQKKAALAEAEQNVRQLKASLDQAAAGTERANAQVTLAQQNYDRQAE